MQLCTCIIICVYLSQVWTDAFRGSPDLKAVELCYQELKQKGLEFPATDMDNMAPIHTPKVM